MRWALLLPTVCLALVSSRAQIASVTPEEALKQESARAWTLYEKHAYSEAASVLEKLSANPQITALADWPDRLYDLACDQARAGRPADAIHTLQHAFELGAGSYFATEHLGSDEDLVSLHKDPRFQELLARKAKEESLWKDDPAIATPYKPVLTEDEKIAGLSKIWSEARFNFPFFSRLPDLDWDALYMQYLPQVRAAQTTADYYRLLTRFVATLHDGHTEIWPPEKLRGKLSAAPPLRTARIGGKVLVTEVYDPALRSQGLCVGAEIVAIDGQPVNEYAENNVAPYASGSTPQDRENRTYGYMLLQGSKADPVQLSLLDASGETKVVSVHRYCEASSKCTWPSEPVRFEMLAGGVAYLAVNEFEDDLGAKAMRDNFATIASAKGLILDLRRNFGGNQKNALAILSMLTDKPFANVRVRMLDYKPDERAGSFAPDWVIYPAEQVKPDSAHFYAKPVVVLAGPGTFSAAENFVVVFDEMHRGSLVGEATPGSTGDSVIFKLPGGGSARIMMADVEYADGRVFEGIGVSPKVQVSPTVADIRLGKDTALERAVEALR